MALEVARLFHGLRPDEEGIWQVDGPAPVSYPADGNQTCQAIEGDSRWFAHRNRCIVALVEAHPPPGDGTLLDIGGGNGMVSEALRAAGRDVIMLEPGPVGAQNARRSGIPLVICARFESLDFHPGAVPAAGLFDVLEHIRDDLGFLRRLHRLLQPGGCLYLTVPAWPALWSHADAIAGHQRRYTLPALTGTLRAAGFKIAFASYFFRLLAPPIVALRSVPFRLGAGREAIRRGIVTGFGHGAGDGLLVRTAYAAMRDESARLAAGEPMAMGASCIVAARVPIGGG
jgi:SAM-dependent methyltransferase